MRDQNASPRRAVADLAHRQHGVVGHGQLVGLGMSPSAVGRWAAGAQLHRIHRGVYAVGHARLTAHGRWMAAVLACGHGALLSHQSAAALWGLRRSSSSILHVTTPARGNPAGIRVHRVRRLHPEDRARAEGIPATSIARTLLDLSETIAPRQLIRSLEQAERLGLFDLGAFDSLLTRGNGRRGVTPLRMAIAAVAGEPPRLNSEWERDLLDLCDDHDIPRPELNVIVEGYEVDALWRELKLIVELDSYAFHRSRRAFEEDRRRDCVLQLRGYVVLRLTRLDGRAARTISAAIAAR